MVLLDDMQPSIMNVIPMWRGSFKKLIMQLFVTPQLGRPFQVLSGNVFDGYRS